MRTQIQILDCTIRDGGYVNNWHFNKKLVREIYKALSKAGVDYFEIGFRRTKEYSDGSKYGLWRFSEEGDIRDVIKNIDGVRLALMVDYGCADINNLCDAKDSAVELIRVAVHKNDLKGAINFLDQAKAKGYKVSLNAMGYTNYSKNEREEFVELVRDADLDYVYVADSYGSLFPDQIERIFEPLLEIPGINLGFHPHNNLQMAFANTIEAIRCGVHMVDCTIYGMGRAAGNLPTEIIISFLERQCEDRYNSVPLLNIVDRYFVSMQKENTWGYQLPYMLSGMFQCHPDYAKTLLDYREYTLEDIWKAMAFIKGKNPVGFSRELIDFLISAGHIGTLQNVLYNNHPIEREKLQRNKRRPNYVNRYKDKDFLILANGPTLKEYKPKIDRFITKYNPVIIGANYLGGLFKPHYHAFNNKRRFVEYVDTVLPDSELLIGQYIPDELVHDYIARAFENIVYIDEYSDFGIDDDGVITSNCRTIAVLLLGVAIVMGAKRVFAAGMDGYIGICDLHFYNEKDEKEDRDMIIERHRLCQKYIEQIDGFLNKRNIEGVNILTPTSYKSFYKGIDNYL